jgi:hypothetical protein
VFSDAVLAGERGPVAWYQPVVRFVTSARCPLHADRPRHAQWIPLTRELKAEGDLDVAASPVAGRLVSGAWLTTPMMMRAVAAAGTPPPGAQITLPGVAAAVPAARRFTAGSLTGCPRAGDLVLAVSELASNAVAHSASGEGGTFTIRVRTAPRWARVEVTDAGPARLPSRTRNGWGLRIVAEIADRSGAVIGPDRTRTAFAEATWTLP